MPNLLELIKQENKMSVYTVKLNLGLESRYIATLDTSGAGTLIIKRRFKHLFRKNNSLGINYELLTSSNIKFFWINIFYEDTKLITTRNYFLKYGKCFEFKSKGFELQIFLELAEFSKDKALQFEEHLKHQSSSLPTFI